MEILAHRGYWNSNIANNSEEALFGALKNGYGFESDIRDYMGRMVISHNIADSSSPDAESVFAELARYGDKYCFAINIKADGLKVLLMELLGKYGINNYFTFDMSVPQMIEYSEMNIRFFTRQSEYEKNPVMYDQAAGVWIDAFFDDSWITEKLLQDHLTTGKKVCIVSPDLHKREYTGFWEKLRGFDIDLASVILCTDHPDEAKRMFGGV